MKSSFKIIFLLLLSAQAFLNTSAQNPKLLEFGWDCPDVDQLSKTLPAIQNTPFDGICFKLQKKVMEAFDTVANSDGYYQYDKLKNLQWGRYTDNFMVLRGFGITGGRWFDDGAWALFSNNMKGLSKAMAAGNLKGIFFDSEYYYPNALYNPWTYNKTQYPDQSLAEVQSAVKKRGVQFINALQSSKSDFVFLSIWITSLIAEEEKIKPLQDTRDVLLISFIEGLLEAKKTGVKVIDGNEYAYWYKKPSQFLEAAAYLKAATVKLMQSPKAKTEAAGIGIAQPLFYDGLLARKKTFERGYDNATKWQWMEESTRYAMASTDKYVWFYSQELKWWTDKVNDTLVQILQNSRAAYNNSAVAAKGSSVTSMKPALSSSIAVNDGKGYYYSIDPKTPMKTGDAAFTFKWSPDSKKLLLDFAGKTPNSLEVFANASTKKMESSIKKPVSIPLDDFSNGKIVIVAKYADGREASGIQVYNAR